MPMGTVAPGNGVKARFTDSQPFGRRNASNAAARVSRNP